MCGIAASCPSDPDFVATALSNLETRGPDGRQVIDLSFCTLGVNRLAITDIDHGHQPLVSNDGAISVVFNGAIYNAEQLAERFSFSLATLNDGEVIHHLYKRFGLAFADYLEGMYAICIADRSKGCVVAAVDQVGIKPLYLCEIAARVYLASTLRAFPRSMLRHVRRMPPGCVWSSGGEIRRMRHQSYREADIGSLLEQSVLEQIPKEVKWGCMLSGGVDSSLIAAVAVATHPPGSVRTFTCGVSDSTDLLAARKVAEYLGTDHHEILIDADELPELVDSVIRETASIERWTVSPGVATYITARFARANDIKVLLAGEGADELFGGYDEFQNTPPVFLNSLLMQYQADLGATECLRLDRATMAHSIEARVPYLSTSLMRAARRLGPERKINNGVRKIALREYAVTRLPQEIAFRRKEEFANGSGMSSELRRHADRLYSAKDVADLRGSFPSFPIDDTLSAWFFSRWLSIYGTDLGTEWSALVARGLFRQTSSMYLPHVRDSAMYQEDTAG